MGEYRIEQGLFNFSVQKALGPWPFKNWSIVTFYSGSYSMCERYIAWAKRIDEQDPLAIADITAWVAERYFDFEDFGPLKPEYALHIPKTLGYPFQRIEGVIEGLVQLPKQRDNLDYEWESSPRWSDGCEGSPSSPFYLSEANNR